MESRNLVGIESKVLLPGSSIINVSADTRDIEKILTQLPIQLSYLGVSWTDHSTSTEKPFEEPESHERARDILGERNFHGVSAAEEYFGIFSDDERAERTLLRLRDHRGEFLSEDATLALLKECTGDFVLCAMHSLDLCSIHAAQKGRFTADQKNPWFGEPAQREKFSCVQNPDPWVLMRKEILPGSTNKKVEGKDGQKLFLSDSFPQERSVLPAEFASAAIIHFGETGEKLGGDKVIRFFVQTAEGCWLYVYWHGDRLDFYFWLADAYDCFGLLSARTS